MKNSIFIKIWLPIALIITAITVSFVFIEGDQSLYQVFGFIVLWIMIAIQLLDWKYNFKILNDKGSVKEK